MSIRLNPILVLTFSLIGYILKKIKKRKFYQFKREMGFIGGSNQVYKTLKRKPLDLAMGMNFEEENK